jgi:hypothetical protein
MTTKGIRVYFVNDQTGISDAAHTKALFDTVMYDTDGEWDTTNHIWRPKFTVPTIVKLDANISWGPPSGASIHYGKIWTHWQNSDTPPLSLGLGEGSTLATADEISIANPRIGYSDQRLCQPGDFCHIAVEFFSGANGHVIQSGSGDSPDATPNRSYFSASYEA